MENKITETVGIFDDQSKLDKAVAELESTAFARHEISVLGSVAEMKERFGKKTLNPETLENNPHTPRGISIRPEEKTIGATAFIGVLAYIGGVSGALMVNPASNAILFSAIGIGSILGGILAGAIVYNISEHFKTRTLKQLKKGGLLLWVRTEEPMRERIAKKIMKRCGAQKIHVQTIS